MKKNMLLLIVTFLFQCSLYAQDVFELKPSFVENFSSGRLNSDIWGMDIAEFKGHNVYFTAENNNVENGVLNIILKKEKYKNCGFTSSSLWTKPNNIKFGYGKLMIRAKIPTTKDCRPAIWLKALNSSNQLFGEIDILEHWPEYGKKEYQTNFHLWGRIKGENQSHTQYPIVVRKYNIANWHVYSVEYTNNSLVMKIDDQIVAQWNKNQLPDWPENINYQLYLSLACSTWSSNHVAESVTLPQTMKVDWIKFYKLK